MDERFGLAEVGADSKGQSGESRVWHSPNIVALCIDAYDAKRQEGRLYHQYTADPIRFSSLFAALGQMDDFYDDIRFPCASMCLRSFFVDRKAAGEALRREKKLFELPEFKRKDMSKMEAFHDVIGHRGTDATFIVRVQYRQHASWQGEVTWVDTQKKEYFRSALELVKLIDGALNGEEKTFEQ